MLWNLIPLAVMTLIVFYLKLAIISYILINIDIRPFETRYRPIYRSISRFKRPAATQASFCGFHANLQMSLLCLLCFSSIIKPQDKNLVKSSRTEFSVKEELESLPFTVQIEYSQHICRKCLGQLKKRRALIRNLSNLDALIFDNYSTKAAEIGYPPKENRKQDRSPLNVLIVRRLYGLQLHYGHDNIKRLLRFLLCKEFLQL